MNLTKKNLIMLVVCILLPLVVGFTASLATATSVGSWYTTLQKPFFTPPNYLFGPVWTVLYVLMGVSSFLVFLKKDAPRRNMALSVYGIQLGLNFGWSFIFFYFQNPAIALINIVLLWMFILLMIRLFYKTDTLAAFLQIPYLMWVTYATALNMAIWWLN